GPGGRITQEDVEAAAQRGATDRGRTEQAASSPTGVPRAGDVIPMRGMRKVIADRMLASLQQMAQLTMEMSVTMDEAVKLRGQLIDEWASDGIRPSYTDFVI